MNRRDTLLALAALGAAPESVLAQSGTRTYRVAVVFTGSADSERSRLEAFQQGLQRHGHQEGGNITGNTVLATAFIPKSLELLHETLPAVRSFGVLTDPAMQASRITWSALEGTAKRLRVGLERFDASTPEEIDRVLGILAKRRPGALLVFLNPLFGAHRKRMIESLTRERIPQSVLLRADRVIE